METSNVVLTVASENEILWCHDSNESSSAVFSLGAICFSILCKMKFGIFLDFGFWLLLGKESKGCGEVPLSYQCLILIRFSSTNTGVRIMMYHGSRCKRYFPPPPSHKDNEVSFS